MTCRAMGCTEDALSRGLCRVHYDRARHKINKMGRSVKEFSDDQLSIMSQDTAMGQCSLGGCTRQARARGLCERHYRNARRNAERQGLDFNKLGRERLVELGGDYYHLNRPEHGKCRVENCDDVARIRGFCTTHYQRVQMRLRIRGKSISNMTDDEILDDIVREKT